MTNRTTAYIVAITVEDSSEHQDRAREGQGHQRERDCQRSTTDLATSFSEVEADIGSSQQPFSATRYTASDPDERRLDGSNLGCSVDNDTLPFEHRARTTVSCQHVHAEPSSNKDEATLVTVLRSPTTRTLMMNTNLTIPTAPSDDRNTDYHHQQ